MKGFAQFYEKINVEFLNISEKYVLNKDTFNKIGYKAKINTHTTSYIN